MIYATAGHVDHGKTSLIRSLTDIDTDRLPEEKRRGLSIDLGFAYVDLGDGEKIGFVDVPGHERFVRTMVAGVGSIDAVLFVIALDDGPMPQTAEHLAILSLLGVSSGVVVFTKTDRVDEERKLEVKSIVKDILLPTFLKESREFCVSTKTGEGIKELRKFLLENKKTLRRESSDGLFRMAVDRSFSLRGAGKVITGSIFSGCLELNQTIRHLPSGRKFRIRNLHAQGGNAEGGLRFRPAALQVLPLLRPAAVQAAGQLGPAALQAQDSVRRGEGRHRGKDRDAQGAGQEAAQERHPAQPCGQRLHPARP